MASLGSSVYSILSSAHSDRLTSFPIWIPFTSFSSLIALPRMSKMMLNKNGPFHVYLVLSLRGNVFSFSPLRMMLAVDLSCLAFIMLRDIAFMPTFWRVFIINGWWILSETFSASTEWSYGFHSSICWCGVSHLLIWGCWKILTSLGWITEIMISDHGVWSF